MKTSKTKTTARRALALLLLAVTMLAACATAVGAIGLGSGVAVSAHGVTMIKSALKGKTIFFSDTDFKCALGVPELKKITVTSLPLSTDGKLMYQGRRVREGQSIARRNLADLSFVPASAEIEETRFRFTATEGSGAEILCILRFADKVNQAPKIGGKSEGEIQTQKNIGYYGRLSATDPEGDYLEFLLVGAPKNGRLTRIGTNGSDYLYTPDKGFTGTDRFVYVARDEYGNYSLPETVIVTVTERLSEVEYVDMKTSPDYNAAVTMTAMNVMGGKLVGDDLYFEPENAVTRAEFVAMAMKAKGIRADSTLTKTYFDDNETIPPSLVGYVATAQKIGIVNGEFENGKLLFSPNRAITKYEAAVVLANLTLQQGDAELTVFAVENDVPVYARASVYKMLATGVFSSAENLGEQTTRADAARFLYRSM